MKFEMVDKGYEYKVEGMDVTLKKKWRRVAVTHTGHVTLDRYADKSFWYVYGLDDNIIYEFHKLADAKAFVISKLA